MKKGQLKALFIEAKGTGQKYIGVMIQTEGSSEPEVIINPKENFNASIKDRNWSIRQDVWKGKSILEVSKKYELSQSQIYKILKSRE